MKILVLTFYYSPDLCAGSFRATPFVQELTALAGTDAQIDVLTTMPNRYNSFAATAVEHEQTGQSTVRRITLPKHKSGFKDQALAFRAFAAAVLRQVQGSRYDVVFATSSRLFTAYLGALVANRVRARLYLDLRDLFAENMKELLPGYLTPVLVPLFRAVENYTLKRADKVNLVSAGFKTYFESRYPQHAYTYYTNGIDDEFLCGSFEKLDHVGRRIIAYAGNIGAGQGLHKIIPTAAKSLGPEYEFRLYGDGGAVGVLRKALMRDGITNVKLNAPVTRKELLDVYRTSDYLFLHLNDLKAFDNVLPSKIFEYAATGKPIIAGVSGYAREFLEAHVSNCVVFKPCDAPDFVAKLKRLSPVRQARPEFIETFSRRSIMRLMAADVFALAGGKREGK